MIRTDFLRLATGMAAALGLLLCLAADSPAEPARLRPGDIAPDFTLTDLDGKEHQLSALLGEGRIVVLEWYSPECPISVAYHMSAAEGEAGMLQASYEKLSGDDLIWLAVNSVSPDQDGNSLEDNQRLRDELKIPYPMLLDSDFSVAEAFGAQKTPDIFIIGADGKIAYTGGVDEGNFKDYPAGVNHIVETVEALRAGKPLAVTETEPFGCAL